MGLGEEMRTWKPSTVLTFWGMVIGAWAGVSLTLGVQVWSWATGTPVPGNPFDLVGAIARGRVAATTGMWVCVGATGALVLAIGLLPRLARAGGCRRERGDEAARRTGRRRDTRGINENTVRAKAKRLVKTDIDAFGLPIGKAVNDRRRLWSSFEDVCTVIAGPRAGKTTCWVVPRVLSAPGLVVTTSNKRDVLDETRQVRGGAGTCGSLTLRRSRWSHRSSGGTSCPTSPTLLRTWLRPRPWPWPRSSLTPPGTHEHRPTPTSTRPRRT